MEVDAREFGLFIDGLRLDRNMSREDLCEGIVSLSQYKRYLRGNTSIPNDTLVLLADRLKFRITDLHQMYTERTDKQYKDINKIYDEILSRKYQSAYNLCNKMKTENILSDFNKLFFDFCLINIQHNLNMVSDIHVLGMYSELIDYPECASNESFNWIEFNILLFIVTISSKIENFEPADIVTKLLLRDDFSTNFSGDKKIIPHIYRTIAQINGKQGFYDTVVKLSNKGIKFCTDNFRSNSLSHLLIINSFAHQDLGNTDEALESAKRAFMQIYLEDNPEKFNSFKTIFENRFEMKLDDLIKLN